MAVAPSQFLTAFSASTLRRSCSIRCSMATGSRDGSDAMIVAHATAMVVKGVGISVNPPVIEIAPMVLHSCGGFFSNLLVARSTMAAVRDFSLTNRNSMYSPGTTDEGFTSVGYALQRRLT